MKTGALFYRDRILEAAEADVYDWVDNILEEVNQPFWMKSKRTALGLPGKRNTKWKGNHSHATARFDPPVALFLSIKRKTWRPFY